MLCCNVVYCFYSRNFMFQKRDRMQYQKEYRVRKKSGEAGTVRGACGREEEAQAQGQVPRSFAVAVEFPSCVGIFVMVDGWLIDIL